MVDIRGASKTEELRQIVAEHFKVDPLTLKPHTTFIEDLSADEIDLSELRIQIEHLLGIDLPHLDDVRTYGELETVVAKAST